MLLLEGEDGWEEDGREEGNLVMKREQCVAGEMMLEECWRSVGGVNGGICFTAAEIIPSRISPAVAITS